MSVILTIINWIRTELCFKYTAYTFTKVFSSSYYSLSTMMLVDDDGIRVVLNNAYIPRDEQQIVLHRNHDPDFPESGSVSSLHRCQSQDAKKLCIFDLAHKLKHGGEYDIGGTYTGSESDVWFYYSTSICPGYNYLLNLFVCHRKPGNISIGVSSSNELTQTQRPTELAGWAVLQRSLAWFNFKSAEANESYHIKTFCFSEKDVKILETSTLFIPISLNMNASHVLNNEVIKSIKLQHDLSALLSKKEKTDFVLESVTGKTFPTHKIILAAHSPSLRNLIKESKNSSEFIDISDNDMELLLEFLYTGAIKDIFKQDCVNLLKIADKFELKNLFTLTQFAIGEQINIDNAVDIALLSKKYKLDKLQAKVFSYIKNNPKVMQTDSWKHLKDVELTKQLLEHIYSGRD